MRRIAGATELKRVRTGMRWARTIVLSLAIVVSAGSSFQTPALAEKFEGGTGIAHGKDHAFFLTAPDGWILDTSCGAGQGLFCCFYPKGSNWNGPAVMYSNAAGRDNRTLLQAIEHDIESFKEKSPHVKIEDGGTLPTRDGKKALVRQFAGDKWANHEAVGYVAENKVVVNIVLTARKRDDYEKSLPAFRKLVESYKFITDKPEKVDLYELASKAKQAPLNLEFKEAGGDKGKSSKREKNSERKEKTSTSKKNSGQKKTSSEPKESSEQKD